MATWIVGSLLAVLFVLVVRYVAGMFRSGKCVGCSEKGCAHCSHCQGQDEKV